MFGILVVATFLWVLPCDVQPCEGELAMRDTEWAVRIERMGKCFCHAMLKMVCVDIVFQSLILPYND